MGLELSVMNEVDCWGNWNLGWGWGLRIRWPLLLWKVVGLNAVLRLEKEKVLKRIICPKGG